MKPNNCHKWGFWAVHLIRFGCLVALCILGPLSQVQASTFPMFTSAITWAGNHTFWLLPLTGIVAASEIVLRYIGSPKKWEAVHAFMDGLQQQIFDGGAGTPVHEQRVTLFARHRIALKVRPKRSYFWQWGYRWWPWSGWLIPVSRSGHTTQSSCTVFLCPDDVAHAEGVAGRAWERNGHFTKPSPHNLNNLWRAKEQSRQRLKTCQPHEEILAKEQLDRAERDLSAAIEDYAEVTSVSPQWVKFRLQKKRPCPRWMHSFPVEVNNKPWGVVVIEADRALFTDSIGEAAFSAKLDFFKKLLGSMLESL